MQLAFKEPFLSIRSLPDTEIPPFCVVTGPNGSGKTHLLKAINDGKVTLLAAGTQPRTEYLSWENFKQHDTSSLERQLYDQMSQLSPNFTNLISKRHDIIANSPKEFLHFIADIKVSDADAIAQARARFGEEIVSNFLKVRKDILASIRKQIHGNNRDSTEAKAVQHMMKYGSSRFIASGELNDFISEVSRRYGSDTPLRTQLSNIIWTYNRNFLINQQKKLRSEAGLATDDFMDDEKFIEIYGPDPLLYINSLIAKLGFRYQISQPPTQYDTSYTARLIDPECPNEPIQFSTLSSGEHILISLALLIYTINDNVLQPMLPTALLLDEIDAPLHPSMTPSMMEILNETLVLEHGFKIILATHSVSTVALSPEGSLYRLMREPRELKISTREEAIQDLSRGVVTVTDSTKIVLVEGNDATIYNSLFKRLSLGGFIGSSPALAFVGAIDKPRGTGGDKAQVVNWTGKLSQAGLKNVFGLVDRDEGRELGTGIVGMDRYSIENYLYDPIIIFATLLNRGKHRLLYDREFDRCEASAILECGSEEIQAIADEVCRKISSMDSELSRHDGTFVAKYVGGGSVTLPVWYRDCAGHRIAAAVGALVERELGLATLERPNFSPLIETMEGRVPEFISRDFVDVFSQIQGFSP